MVPGWILIPLISALIGWLANRWALFLLFHPRYPIRILGYNFQGFFPKKQKQFAENLGKLVSRQLFSYSDIEEKITHPGNVQRIMPIIEQHIDEFLRVKLPVQMPVISMFIGDRTLTELKTVFIAELETLFPVIMKSYMENLENNLEIEKLIMEKMHLLTAQKIEKFLYEGFSKEVRSFQIAGALIGFLLGVLQVLITSLFIITL